MNKEHLLKILRNSLSTKVKFIKKDGSVRIMDCTLHPDVLPTINGSSYYENDSEYVVVWDNEKDGWRMVNIDCEVLNEISY